MSDLSEKQWQEYLAKEDRDMMWRAYFDLCAATATFTITGQQDLHDECAALSKKVEERLKQLYGEAK